MIIHTFMSTMKKMDVDVSKIKINIARQSEVVKCGTVSSLCEIK